MNEATEAEWEDYVEKPAEPKFGPIVITAPEGYTYTVAQETALKNVVELTVNDRGIGIVAGYAGTGKSTILSHVVEALRKAGRDFSVVCPTGRAAARLRAAGVHSASTIHSWLYVPVQNAAGELIGFKKREDMDLPPQFVLIVDEASMVTPTVLDDMATVLMPRLAGRSMIIVGDDFQLPPVMNRGERAKWGQDFSALDVRSARMYAPSHTRKGTLRDVVRQSEDNPVLRLATALRKKVEPPIQIDPRLTVLRKGRSWMADAIQKNPLRDGRVYLTWTNRDRQALNAFAREALRFDRETNEIVEGERLVVTMNNRNLGVCNGDLLDVVEVESVGRFAGRMLYAVAFVDPYGVEKDAELVLFARPTDGVKGNPSAAALAKMISDEPEFGTKPMIVDYGYCLTCHKAQGSEWREVFVYAPDALTKYMPDDQSTRWLYTAITRTTDSVTFAGGSYLASVLGA